MNTTSLTRVCRLGLVSLLLLSGCHQMTHTEAGALTGAGIGTAAGAVVGHQNDHLAEGALVGAAAGALTGGAIGNAHDERDRAIAQASYHSSSTTTAREPLTNGDLVRMAQSGLNDQVIINAIHDLGGRFDLSAEGLIALRAGGVSDTVIAAIQQAARPPSTVVLPTTSHTYVVVPHSPGIGLGVSIVPRTITVAPRPYRVFPGRPPGHPRHRGR